MLFNATSIPASSGGLVSGTVRRTVLPVWELLGYRANFLLRYSTERTALN